MCVCVFCSVKSWEENKTGMDTTAVKIVFMGWGALFGIDLEVVQRFLWS